MANIKVRRGNVMLTVPDYQRGEYLAKGFDIVDNAGIVVENSIPTDPNVLKRAYVEHLALIKAKDAEIASLKAKINTKTVEADNNASTDIVEKSAKSTRSTSKKKS